MTTSPEPESREPVTLQSMQTHARTDSDTAFNVDIRSGDWRLLNLEAAPFKFPKPEHAIRESGAPHRRHGSFAFLGILREARVVCWVRPSGLRLGRRCHARAR